MRFVIGLFAVLLVSLPIERRRRRRLRKASG